MTCSENFLYVRKNFAKKFACVFIIVMSNNFFDFRKDNTTMY